MAEAFYLSEEDRDDLRALFNEWASERLNPANRAPANTEDYPTTGSYVAYFPDGIERLNVFSGTGSSLEAEPGVAQCTLYRLLEFSGAPLLYPLGVNDATAYNVSNVAISAGRWAIITQDKFNDWYVLGAGGAGTGEDLGDEIRKVVVQTAMPPSPGSGTGSLDDYTYLYSGYRCDIADGGMVLGQVTPDPTAPFPEIYIIQRSQTIPETQRLLKLGGVYTAHFLGFSDLGFGYREVYAVLASVVASTPQQVVTDILGVTAICNGNGTITTTVSFTKAIVGVSST